MKNENKNFVHLNQNKLASKCFTCDLKLKKNHNFTIQLNYFKDVI